jgi:hypothetical protein
MKQIKGQITLFDAQETETKIQEGKQAPEIAKEKPKEEPGCFAEYIGRCNYCYWGQDENTCPWSDKNQSRYAYGGCHDKSRWQPHAQKIKGLCGGCKHSNDFHYHGDFHNPDETPDIYCTRKEDEENPGPINRKKPFAEFEDPGFGIGTWHRQHEWDTCDAWEPDPFWWRINQDGTIEPKD